MQNLFHFLFLFSFCPGYLTAYLFAGLVLSYSYGREKGKEFALDLVKEFRMYYKNRKAMMEVLGRFK